MSDPRYSGGVLAGIHGSMHGGVGWPWPTELARYGKFAGGQPLSRCAVCPPEAHPSRSATFVVYGNTPVCLDCARALEGEPRE